MEYKILNKFCVCFVIRLWGFALGHSAASRWGFGHLTIFWKEMNLFTGFHSEISLFDPAFVFSQFYLQEKCKKGFFTVILTISISRSPPSPSKNGYKKRNQPFPEKFISQYKSRFWTKLSELKRNIVFLAIWTFRVYHSA